jgi:hypothetical protein
LGGSGGSRQAKARRRDYYYEQREKAREMFEKYNLSDEEIERIIERLEEELIFVLVYVYF